MRHLAILLLLLAACDSAEVELAIPDSEEQNYASFRLDGYPHQAGPGSTDVGFARGFVRFDSENAPLTELILVELEAVREGEQTEYLYHILHFFLRGTLTPGIYTYAPGDQQASLVYLHGSCPTATYVSLQYCEEPRDYRLRQFSVDIDAADSTGFAGTFSASFTTPEGNVLRLNDGRATIRFIDI